MVAEVRDHVTAEADRAVAAGVRPDGIVIDPAHDFGKNTWQSLQLTRRTADLVATGWPVLVAVSNKDFVGRPSACRSRSGPRARSPALAVCAWEGRGCSACTTCPAPATRWRRSRRCGHRRRWRRSGQRGPRRARRSGRDHGEWKAAKMIAVSRSTISSLGSLTSTLSR